VRFGYHLPQFGDAAVTGAIQRAAQRAEELGFDDVWVSDHLVVPVAQARPAPLLYDPLMALAFAAAATTRIGIGTNVLVAPQYPSPLALANSLASLDSLSGGRLTLGVGSGWSRAEFAALGAPFDHRGTRLEEIVALCREVWSDDPSRHDGLRYPSFSGMRVLPKPAHEIPVWLGGRSEAALARAARIGDGFAGVGHDPAESRVVAQQLRAERPEDAFTVSMRVPIGQQTTAIEFETLVGEYAAAGVGHLLFAPDRGDPGRGGIDTWIRDMEDVAAGVLPVASLDRGREGPRERPGRS
jgi:probable F420-dependent oxidoreductase